jgi:hypothetical protein
MNDISSASSAAGSPAERGRTALLVAAALALAACGPRPPPTAQDLAPDTGDFPRIARIETLVYVSSDPDDSAAPGNVLSGGRYAYHLGPPNGGVLKTLVLLFPDEQAARAHWQHMHKAEALAATTPLDAGDEGWIYGDKMAATRVGRSIFEVKARGAAGRLADFTRACARKARERLDR